MNGQYHIDKGFFHDLLAPNSTFAEAFPRTMGGVHGGWKMLTMRSLQRCSPIRNICSCWKYIFIVASESCAGLCADGQDDNGTPQRWESYHGKNVSVQTTRHLLDGVLHQFAALLLHLHQISVGVPRLTVICIGNRYAVRLADTPDEAVYDTASVINIHINGVANLGIGTCRIYRQHAFVLTSPCYPEGGCILVTAGAAGGSSPRFLASSSLCLRVSSFICCFRFKRASVILLMSSSPIRLRSSTKKRRNQISAGR